MQTAKDAADASASAASRTSFAIFVTLLLGAIAAAAGGAFAVQRRYPVATERAPLRTLNENGSQRRDPKQIDEACTTLVACPPASSVVQATHSPTG